jgi:hypothetical protein
MANVVPENGEAEKADLSFFKPRFMRRLTLLPNDFGMDY